MPRVKKSYPDRTRTIAGPVTVISPNTKNERGWSRAEAIEMLKQGYTQRQVLKITGIYVRPPRTQY